MFAEGGCSSVELDAKAAIKQKEILNLQAVRPFVLHVPLQRGAHALPSTLCSLAMLLCVCPGEEGPGEAVVCPPCMLSSQGAATEERCALSLALINWFIRL